MNRNETKNLKILKKQSRKERAPTAQELKNLLPFALKITEKAGSLLLGFEKELEKLSILSKGVQGLVSSADLASEHFLISSIRKKFPDHFIYAEEIAYREKLSNCCDQKPFSWIIDPLDGTTNYLHGFSYYSVSIALAYYGVPFLGIVLAPRTGECFYALKGQGAFYRPTKKASFSSFFREKNTKSIEEALIVTQFSVGAGEELEEDLNLLGDFFYKVGGVRRIGSAALEICYVAKGIFDGIWAKGLAPWDLAAATLICEEAGVKIKSMAKGKTKQKNPKKFSPLFSDSFIAARNPLLKKIQRSFPEYFSPLEKGS